MTVPAPPNTYDRMILPGFSPEPRTSDTQSDLPAGSAPFLSHTYGDSPVPGVRTTGAPAAPANDPPAKASANTEPEAEPISVASSRASAAGEPEVPTEPSRGSGSVSSVAHFARFFDAS